MSSSENQRYKAKCIDLAFKISSTCCLITGISIVYSGSALLYKTTEIKGLSITAIVLGIVQILVSGYSYLKPRSYIEEVWWVYLVIVLLIMQVIQLVCGVAWGDQLVQWATSSIPDPHYRLVIQSSLLHTLHLLNYTILLSILIQFTFILLTCLFRIIIKYANNINPYIFNNQQDNYQQMHEYHQQNNHQQSIQQQNHQKIIEQENYQQMKEQENYQQMKEQENYQQMKEQQN